MYYSTRGLCFVASSQLQTSICFSDPWINRSPAETISSMRAGSSHGFLPAVFSVPSTHQMFNIQVESIDQSIKESQDLPLIWVPLLFLKLRLCDSIKALGPCLPPALLTSLPSPLSFKAHVKYPLWEDFLRPAAKKDFSSLHFSSANLFLSA